MKESPMTHEEELMLMEKSRGRIHELASIFQTELLFLRLGRLPTDDERIADWQTRMRLLEWTERARKVAA